MVEGDDAAVVSALAGEIAETVRAAAR